MAADADGRVSIKAKDGSSKFLKFSNRVLMDLEKQQGINFLGLITDQRKLQDNLSITIVNALVWAGLRGAGNKHVTLDQVVDHFVDIGRLDEYLTAIFDGIAAVLGGAKKEETTEDPLPDTGEQPPV